MKFRKGDQVRFKAEFLNDGESGDDVYLVMEDSQPENDGREHELITVGFAVDKDGVDRCKNMAIRPTERVGINMIEKIDGELNVTKFIKRNR